MVWKVMEIHGVWKGKIGMERMEWNWRKGKRNERKDGMEIGIWNLKGMTTHWEYKDLPITATIHSCACYWMNASPPLPAMLQAIASFSSSCYAFPSALFRMAENWFEWL